jgi:hypothetical protein
MVLFNPVLTQSIHFVIVRVEYILQNPVEELEFRRHCVPQTAALEPQLNGK